MRLFKKRIPFFLTNNHIKPNPDLLRDPNKIAQLFLAVENNEVENVEQAIKNHFPLTVVDDENYTLLTAAAFEGADDVVVLLLQNGLNPAFHPAKHPNKLATYNAFHAACAGGKGAIAAYLLDHFPHLLNSVEPRFSQTGLQIAILHEHYSLALAFLNDPQYPIDLFHVDKRRRTVLATALGALAREGFMDDISLSPKLQEFETLCLELLDRENAFLPINNNRSAISVLLYFELALYKPSGEKHDKQIKSHDLIFNLMTTSPKLAVALYQQALQVNNDDAKQFLQHFGEASYQQFSENRQQAKETQATLRVAMK